MGWAAKKFLEPSNAVAPAGSPGSIPANAWLEVHFIDVGQGDAIWIHTHDDGVQGNAVFEGRSIVIDGGPDASDQKNELRRYIEERAHHDAVIDALILTHPHDDHYPGAEGLLRHFEVRRYYDPGFPKGGTAYPAFLDQAKAETVDGAPAKIMIGRGEFDALDYWGAELTAEFPYSYPGVPTGLGSGSTRENNASIVLRLEYGSHVFLFMGDAEGKARAQPDTVVRIVEGRLLDSIPAAKLRATVLKAGHHGSETSSTLPFLQAVNPEIGRRHIRPQEVRATFPAGRFGPSTVLRQQPERSHLPDGPERPGAGPHGRERRGRRPRCHPDERHGYPGRGILERADGSGPAEVLVIRRRLQAATGSPWTEARNIP